MTRLAYIKILISRKVAKSGKRIAAPHSRRAHTMAATVDEVAIAIAIAVWQAGGAF